MVKNSKLLFISTICVLLALVFTVPSFASLGKIAGVVKDVDTGEALPGANLQIEGTTYGASADQNGRYFIVNVPPGRYTVKVTFMGYTTQAISNVRAQIDVTTELNVSLKPTVIEGETVSIVAERPVVDKTMTATKITFAEEIVDNVMPVTGLNEILQTSVTTQSMRGANKTGVAYMIDGVNITDIMTAAGGGTDGYTNVKRNTNSTGNTTSGSFVNESALDPTGRMADMVQTTVDFNQSSVAEANVIAGTFNA
ncbi:carboxypeptidase-like regulatory domain-containing protein, partial [candidate division KSB1 bacterium]|nr:carboxypeptidase-like regulatory domain-containing protein [candidate division KSB1 bacterium]